MSMKHPVSYELINPQVCVGAVCMSTSSWEVEVSVGYPRNQTVSTQAIHSCCSTRACVRRTRSSRETIQFLKRQGRCPLPRSKKCFACAEETIKTSFAAHSGHIHIHVCSKTQRIAKDLSRSGDSPPTRTQQYVNRASLRTTKLFVVGIEAEATVTSLQIGGGYVDVACRCRCRLYLILYC